MRALVYEAFQERPRIQAVPDPSPEPHGVVIRVGASGLCRSDWHGWMGHDPDIRLPHIPGHELAGRSSPSERASDAGAQVIGSRCRSYAVAGAAPSARAGTSRSAIANSSPGSRTGDRSQSTSRSTMQTKTSSGFRTRWTTSRQRAWGAGSRPRSARSCIRGSSGRGVDRGPRLRWRRTLGDPDRACPGASVVAVDVDDEKLRMAEALGASVTFHGQRVDDVGRAIRERTGVEPMCPSTRSVIPRPASTPSRA